MAVEGGPKKRISPSVSPNARGNCGSSDACPLAFHHVLQSILPSTALPSRPDGIDVCAFSRLEDELDIGVVVVIRSSRHLYELIGQLHVLSIDPDVFRRRHRDHRHRLVTSKRPDGPHADASHELDGAQSIVRHQDAA